MIKQIILTNFYSFQQETINLDPETNILIGINGSGKSNFLKAIRLLQEGMSDAGLVDFIPRVLGTFENICFKGETGDRVVTLAFLLDHQKLNEISGRFLFREDLNYTIRIIKSPSEKNFYIEEKLLGNGVDERNPFVFLDFKNGQGVISERIEEKQTNRLVRYSDYDPQQLALSKINDSDRYYPQTAVKRALQEIGVYAYFDTTPTSGIRQSTVPLAKTRLSGNGGNLAQILQSIRNRNWGDYTRMIEAAKEVNPAFQEFGVEILSGGSIELALRESGLNSAIHVSGISDGTLRYLCLLAILYNSNRGKIVCIDEPEVGLHPDMIHGISTAIKYASQTSTIIVSTHSPALLNYFDLEQVRVFEKNEQNATVVKQFSEAEFAGWYEEFSVGNMWKAGDLGGVRYGG